MGQDVLPVQCPSCKRDIDLVDWLDGGDAATPPPQTWLWSQCPSCGNDSVFRLSGKVAEIGAVDGFPGPSFIPDRKYLVPALQVGWEETVLKVSYSGRHWAIERGTSRDR